MSFAKPKNEPDIKIRRPVSQIAKLELIRETFSSQPIGGWDAKEQNRYLTSIGLEPSAKNIARTDEELDLILTDMERCRMVLFK